MRPKIILVTGGAGFIGSHVVDSLISSGQTVVILDDLSGGFIKNINSKAKFVKGSINDVKLLDTLFNKYLFDYVYHLAAYAAEGLSPFIREFNYKNNLLGSINLINRAIKFKIKHFVFTSSIAVYGKNQVPMIEDQEPHPEDPYGIAKYAVELDLHQAGRQFGLKYTIFRPHNVYGERQNIADPYRNVIGIFINKIRSKKPLPIFGNGMQKRAFTYIKDIIDPLIRAPYVKEASNSIFNLGSDKPYTILDTAKLIARVMNVTPQYVFLKPRLEASEVFSDHKKLKKIFNIAGNTSLDSGLRKMVAWAIKNKPKASRKFQRIEILENLPEYWLK